MNSEKNNKNLSLNCKGELIDLSTPKVMGILNITPDSFYDGGQFKDSKSILVQTEKLISEGATFVDVGAYSSRPGADFVSENEELHRITPVVELILKHFPKALISIDSFRANVIRECVNAGAVISNDISAGHLDDQMMKTIGELGIPYIMMHMRGTPQTMQNLTHYDHLVTEIFSYFSERIQLAKQHQIMDVVIDPGFGFAKSLSQNYELLGKLEFFQNLNCPILCGVSRKSMIYKTLNCLPKEALNGTTALNMVALMNGANILRVHDVKEAMECVKLFNQL
ncbi:MAG: dihydropteroate synthase [Bacteroidetes bacterium]|nr:dihydropteroate synthase [Bacteroidota bacterium]MDA0860391.1 dihydropteroate synthase [Bacteroidota bacterium]MDA1318603.1 dihydropteroate synthase [Bacteroidota bacterium]